MRTNSEDQGWWNPIQDYDNSRRKPDNTNDDSDCQGQHCVVCDELVQHGIILNLRHWSFLGRELRRWICATCLSRSGNFGDRCIEKSRRHPV
jgi:hypothetical protein